MLSDQVDFECFRIFIGLVSQMKVSIQILEDRRITILILLLQLKV